MWAITVFKVSLYSFYNRTTDKRKYGLFRLMKTNNNTLDFILTIRVGTTERLLSEYVFVKLATVFSKLCKDNESKILVP